MSGYRRNKEPCNGEADDARTAGEETGNGPWSGAGLVPALDRGHQQERNPEVRHGRLCRNEVPPRRDRPPQREGRTRRGTRGRSSRGLTRDRPALRLAAERNLSWASTKSCGTGSTRRTG